jgi:hypothetical protein
VVVAHLLTGDERLTPGKAAGAAVGLVGVVVMLGTDLLAGLGTGLAAQLACLCAALSYAFAGVFGRRFRRMSVPPIATATGQVTASTLVMLPLPLLVERPWALPVPAPPGRSPPAPRVANPARAAARPTATGPEGQADRSLAARGLEGPRKKRGPSKQDALVAH